MPPRHPGRPRKPPGTFCAASPRTHLRLIAGAKSAVVLCNCQRDFHEIHNLRSDGSLLFRTFPFGRCPAGAGPGSTFAGITTRATAVSARTAAGSAVPAATSPTRTTAAPACHAHAATPHAAGHAFVLTVHAFRRPRPWPHLQRPLRPPLWQRAQFPRQPL